MTAFTCTTKQQMEDEVDALSSIYEAAFTDVRKTDAWAVWRPPEVKLALTPLQSSCGKATHCRIVLRVRCGASYPEQQPEIFLEHPEGLHISLVRQLKAELDSLASQHCGEVVIFLLAQHVELFLHNHNVAPSPDASFFDQMNKKQCEERCRAEAAAIAEEARLAQLHKEAVVETERQLREEIARRQAERREQRQRMDSDIGILSGRRASTSEQVQMRPTNLLSRDDADCLSGVSESGDCVVCQRALTGRASRGRFARSLAFPLLGATIASRKVLRSRCIGHGTRGTTVSMALDFETGEMFAVTEWTLNADVAKAVTPALSQEFATLTRLHHAHLCKYVSFMTAEAAHKAQAAQVRVYILSDFVRGTNLKSCLQQGNQFSLHEVYCLSKQLIDALAFLHERSLVHKNLRASSVLLNVDNSISLTDYCVDKRLEDAAMPAASSQPTYNHTRPLVFCKSAKKLDVYRLGLLLLEIVMGREFSAVIASPEIPTRLPSSLRDLLTRCLDVDDQKRWSLTQLRQHAFVMESIPRSLHFNAFRRHSKEVDSVICHEYLSEKSFHDEANDKASIDGPISAVNAVVVAAERPVIDTVDEFYGSSRLKDFEVLNFLGKGAFGDVIKVRNKLDGRYYAVKRVKMNCKSARQNKRMMREVKVLSTMMHENVVRYFNAWIEVDATTENEKIPAEVTSSNVESTDVSEPIHRIAPRTLPKFDINVVTDVEAPPVASLSRDFSSGWNSPSCPASRPDFDDSNSDSSVDILGKSCLPFNSSDSDEVEESVIFDRQDGSDESKQLHKDKVRPAPAPVEKFQGVEKTCLPRQHYIYIQMEFCENTLRDAIIKGLCREEKRLWRLFREIVEGLEHIHKRKIIHRDLKPVNIFLDHDDHAKIGDFGLATSSVRSRASQLLGVDLLKKNSKEEKAAELDRIHELDIEALSVGTSSDMTSNVGTFLYNSPEVTNSVDYTEKVDIYSLGIILFEMCYPFRTGMERVDKIRRLRARTSSLPDDFETVTAACTTSSSSVTKSQQTAAAAPSASKCQQHSQLIYWLVQHNPELRPTATELLSSDNMPPPQMEECTLQEILRSAMLAPESKPYRAILGSFFSQRKPSLITDYLFDVEQQRGRKVKDKQVTHHYSTKRAVHSTFRRVFARHGAVEVDSPLLMPRQADLYSALDRDHQLVQLLDTSGLVVSLPFDQRLSYARLAAKVGHENLPWKRFSLARVFRRQRYAGQYAVAPREAVECAFDILTPLVPGGSNSDLCMLADAEVLHVLDEIVGELPALQSAPLLQLRLNHVLLVKGVLLFCGVPDAACGQVCELFASSKSVLSRSSRDEIVTRLLALGLQDHTLQTLLNIMRSEGSIKEMSAKLKIITKSRSAAASLVKKGLSELEKVLAMAESFGLKYLHKVLLTPNLVKNYRLYSSLMMELSAELHGELSRHRSPSVLAEGGRYDSLLERFAEPGAQCVLPAAVGVSWALDQLVALHLNSKHLEWCETPSSGASRLCDVLVCALGQRSQLSEQVRMVGRLWAAGLSAELAPLDADLELLQKQCRDRRIPHMVLMKETERGLQQLRLRSFEKETRVANADEMIDLVVARCASESTGGGTISSESGCGSGLDGAAGIADCVNRDAMPSSCVTTTGDSGAGCSANAGLNSGSSSSAHRQSRLLLDVHFIEVAESRVNKMTPNMKRKLEAQVWSRAVPLGAALSVRQALSVLVVDLPEGVIATVSAALVKASAANYGDMTASAAAKDVYNAAQRTCAEKHQRHRKYLDRVFDELLRIKTERKVPLCALYSPIDDVLVLIVL